MKLYIPPNGQRREGFWVDLKIKIILHDHPRKCNRIIEEFVDCDDFDYDFYVKEHIDKNK